MPGPPPKPTALKLINGNPGKRGVNKQEPDPEHLSAEHSAAPAWLDARAKAVWDEIVPPLQKAKLVAVIDVQHLALGCVALAQYRLAVERAGEDLVHAAKGQKGESLSAWLIVQSMAFKQATAVLRDFGMSPAARTRIALQPQMDLFGKSNGEGEKDSKYFS